MHRTRILTVLLCLLAAVLLTACGGSAEKTPEPEAAQPIETPEPADAEEPFETPAPEQEPMMDDEGVWVYGQAVPFGSWKLEIAEPVVDFEPLCDVLKKIPSIENVTLSRDCADWKQLSLFEEEWNAVVSAFPNVTFTGRLLIHGEPAAEVTEYVVPNWMELKAEVKAVLRCCPAIRTFDLTDTEVTREQITEYTKTYPNLVFKWTDPTFGVSSSDTEQFTLTGRQSVPDIVAYLCCFPAPKEVDIREAFLSEGEEDALCDRFPEIAFHRMITVNGTETDSYVTEVDLSSAVITDAEALSDRLGRLTRLEKVEMHFCSLTDEQIAEIRDRYPDVKFVWTVRFDRFEVRTDALAFSTKKSADAVERLTSKDVQPLRYCRDLIALDLAHNDLTELDWLSELGQLQVLILADNRKLTDASVIGTLTKLKYLELYKTGVEDLSPIANLSELLDVNLFYLRVTDVTPLLSCTKLERIWLGEQVAARIGKRGADALQGAFPDAAFDFVSANPQKRGWCEHPRYAAVKKLFETGKPVDPFLP